MVIDLTPIVYFALAFYAVIGAVTGTVAYLLIKKGVVPAWKTLSAYLEAKRAPRMVVGGPQTSCAGSKA